ncbi:hypothetical protein BDA96_02G396000 [Sorghum bicolor]|uniref:Uncharacterized protein n=2 Tax=Sorghum bicolor TaxID=4558 RepID=A0A921UV69_SORBI|nr:hypothetical protein BDA96_02G396000 [Sorghum bicolor]OQU90273.1 hypothetical protein SORBI_3002G377501 [Sorghum bicolor]
MVRPPGLDENNDGDEAHSLPRDRRRRWPVSGPPGRLADRLSRGRTFRSHRQMFGLVSLMTANRGTVVGDHPGDLIYISSIVPIYSVLTN